MSESKMCRYSSLRRRCYGLWAALFLVGAGAPVLNAQTALLLEDFEGTFPGAWTVLDADPLGVDAYWDAVNAPFGSLRPHAGNRMGYCAGVGHSGGSINPLYRDSMSSLMIKPIDLRGYSRLLLRFYYRLPSGQACCDSAEALVSAPGAGNVQVWSANLSQAAWTKVLVSLDTFSGLTSNLAFAFNTDKTVVGEGVYLDTIALLGGNGPAHDFFDVPIFIDGPNGTLAASSLGAGKEPQEPNHAGLPGGRSVWFNWTPSSNMTVEFETRGSAFDTLLAVYTGDHMGNLVEVASNNDIAPGVSGSSVGFDALLGRNYIIAVDGVGGASGNVTLNWRPLVDPPHVVNATSQGNPNQVILSFNEALLASQALNAGNYQISGGGAGVSVSAAEFVGNPSVVRLTTGALSPDVSYQVVYSNLRDVDLTPMVPHPQSVGFVHGAEYPPFSILYQRYDDIPGFLLSDLFNDSSFPDFPSVVASMELFEAPLDVGEDHGTLLCGIYRAPVTGNYTFHMASDDQGATFLATDANPAHKTRIAYEPVWNGSRDYTGTERRDPLNPDNRTNSIPLVAGQEVYLEAVAKEEFGGDHLSVAVKQPGQDFSPVIPLSADEFVPMRRFGTTKFRTLGPVTFPQQPAHATVPENATARFEIQLDGTPPWFIQWYRNGLPVPGGIGAALDVGPVSLSQSEDVFWAVVSNAFSMATSSVAVLTVTQDLTAPALAKVSADPSFRKVTVTFTEPVESSSAQNVSNYRVENSGGTALALAGIQLLGGSNAVLVLQEAMPENQFHTVIISGVMDRSANGNTIAPNTQAAFTSWIVHRGLILQEFYDDAGAGAAVNDLLAHPSFPDHPTSRALNDRFASTPNRGDFYGARLSAYFVPSSFGSHDFAARGDDQFRVFLSPDNDPANAALLIDGLTCCGPFEAHTAAPGFPLAFADPYYLEALLKENGGDDYVEVAFQAVGAVTPPDYSLIGAANLAAAANPDEAGSLQILQQPVSLTVEENQAASFSVAVMASAGNEPFIQWQRFIQSGWATLSGVRGDTYEIDPARMTDHEARLRALIHIPGRIVASAEAVLTVVPDVTPPQLVSASSVDLTALGLCFSEPMDGATVSNLAHYSIPGANAVSAVLRPDRKSVALRLDEPVTSPVVAMSGLTDQSGNPLPAATSVAVQAWATAQDVGQPTPLGNHFTCLDGTVEVLAGGQDIWDTFDQFRFVYRTVQHDFDVRTRVTRLDATDAWAKAGLMARESLNGGSRSLYAITTPVDAPGTGLVEAAMRTTPGGFTSSWGIGTQPASSLPDQWLRLRRFGNQFTALHSSDGQTWTQFAATTQAVASTLLVGMAATSHNPNQLTVAQFDDFAFLPTGPIILDPPDSQVVAPGEDIVLSVDASGPAPFTYQWRRNGKNIPGANSSTYVILNAGPADGATYTVVVINGLGIETSIPAEVVISTPQLELTDNFGNGNPVASEAGCGRGSNVNATVEAGEPILAGQPGGRSVWFVWEAPFSGIATFSTAGSGFDTLLGVFQGFDVDPLDLVVANDDAEPLYTSKVVFNATEGETYHVVVDGVGGSAGNIQLCWNLEDTPEQVPVITTQPVSRAVLPGAPATLSIVAQDADRYQWYLNGQPISGANNDTLHIASVNDADVGKYVAEAFRFDVGLQRTFRAFSQPAVLEIGPVSTIVSQDKLESFYPTFSPPLGFTASATDGGGPISVAAGTLTTQILNNIGDGTGLTETNHCGILGNASRWLILTTGDAGMTFRVDTDSSLIPTILAVYESDTLISDRSLVDCAAGGGVFNELEFVAVPGRYYWAVVDGIGSAVGVIHLNWRLGSVPVITQQPADQVARPGDRVVFTFALEGVPSPDYMWSTNGVGVAGFNLPSLTLDGVETPLVVSASVSNFMGMTLSDPARLYIAQPFDLQVMLTEEGVVHVVGPPPALATNAFIIQATTNLVDWTGIATNVAPNLQTDFIDPDALLFPYRFYRIIETVP